MHRTPVSGKSTMYSSQPNLCADDLNEVVRNVNLRKIKKPDYANAMLINEVSEMKQQNTHILQSNAEILQLLHGNSAELKLANERIAVLEADNAATAERVNDLKYQLHEVQKQQKKKMVEIRNVPKLEKENVKDIVNTLYNTLNIKPAEFVPQMYRKGKNDKSPIVIEFHDETQKEGLLTAVKVFNKGDGKTKLNSDHLGIKGDRARVYVSEALTTMTKRIYGEARDLVKNGHFQYCWISRGNVLLRKEEGQAAVQIKLLLYVPCD